MSYSGRRKQPALRRYQSIAFMEIVHDMRAMRGQTFTVLFPRQAGKNEVAAEVLQALLRVSPEAGAAVATAPTFVPQGAIGLARTAEAVRRTDHIAATNGPAHVEGTILNGGRGRAHFLSASREAHVAGHTASIALMADEAQDIEEEWFDRQFRPMAASTAASTALFGTPWDGATLLDEAVARNRQKDAPGSGYAFHHEVSWDEVSKIVPAYGDFVRGERERLGPRSHVFRTQYGLETVESAGTLFSAEALATMEGTHERMRAPLPGERYVAGLDVGGDGERADASVLTVARLGAGGRCEVVELMSWQGVPLGVLEERVAEAARHWGLERLVIDASGMGLGVWSHVQQKVSPMPVERVVFTPQIKSELGYDLQGAAARGELAIFANDGSAEALNCRAEMRACRKNDRPGNHMSWGAPTGHDDYVVSLALALRAVRGTGERRVAMGRRRE